MKKFVCSVCGYIHEGDAPPEKCPQCGVPASKFSEVQEDGILEFVCEHVIGIGAKDQVDEEVYDGLKANFEAECTEVGMYIAMGRQAIREGYPEIGAFYMQAAWEEAEHAAKFAELIGEVVVADTKKNLQMRMEAEAGATLGKFELAKRAKELGYDAIQDTVQEMAKDEARHGKGFEGMLKRYFK